MIILTSLIATSGGIGITIYLRLLVLLRRFNRVDTLDIAESEDRLPTVSVCIPARNEMHAMTQCLERVIASTYPKLEIIVLDDSSVDNTSILIKSFAHAGVRFVEGAPLPGGWLGKNHAQHELYQEASGEFILFLDVDTHLAPHSINQLVAHALADRADMVSVLPTREDLWRASVLFATLRHFWSVISHTRSNPAAASSAWLVKKNLLADMYGGLEKLRVAVTPERIIAKHASSQHAYRFFVSNQALGISYEKKWLSQCQTSIRLLYPFFGGHLLTAVVGLALLFILTLPFIVVPLGLIFEWSYIHTIAFITSIVLVSLYTTYTARIWRGMWLIGGILFPFILAQEFFLLAWSVYAYSTKNVSWKGRPISTTARIAAIKSSDS
jgi:chlorobactene glucosyltransferase